MRTRLRLRSQDRAVATRPPFPFIVGASRSGTTLLRSMLDAHPDMAVPPEGPFAARLWRFRKRYERRNGFDVGRFVDDLLDDPTLPSGGLSFRRDWGLDPGLVRSRLSGVQRIDYSEAIRRLYGLYAEVQGKRRYGDKSPTTVSSMDTIAAIFPEARFLHIIRDARDVALSMLSTSFGPATLADAAATWTRRVGDGRRSGDELGADRYLEVRYEELVAEPGRTLEGICGFIELPFRSEMLAYEGRALDRLPPDQRDHHANLARPPTVGLRDWRRDMPPADVAAVEAVAGDLLAALGYPVGERA